MLDRLSRSWCLFQKSLSVMRREPMLLVFPALSFMATMTLLALIWAGVGTETIISMGNGTDGFAGSGEWWMLPAYFALYLATMTVANFCGAAYYHEIMRGLTEAPVSVSGGFSYAASRFRAIFLWSLLAATVGLILHIVERRAGALGAFVLKLIGMAWAVASVFAVPALVSDDYLDNPIEVLKRSAKTIRSVWGEALVGYMGLNILTTAALFVLLAPGVLAVMLLGTAGWVVAAALVVAFFVFAYVVSVCEKIYIAAMYHYANGQSTASFNENDFAGAFRRKTGAWGR